MDFTTETYMDISAGSFKELEVIYADDHDIPANSEKAWRALINSNDPHRLFRRGNTLVRLEKHDDGAAILNELTIDRMTYEVARAAHWMKRSGKHEVSATPPQFIIRDMLARPDPPIPVLSRIVTVPVFTRDGDLQTTPGYHASSHVYYDPPKGLQVPPVSKRPTAEEIERAKGLLLDDLLGEFPFLADSDRAHTLALLLLSFARDLIDGPTPLHVVEASTPGTGKSLLVDAAVHPSTGQSVGRVSPPKDRDEWRRMLTSKLITAPVIIVLDNVTIEVDSGELANALTAQIWEDRQLGASRMLRLPVRNAWAMTGNNPSLSHEIARRSVRIRLDANVEKPWMRDGFRHKDLLGWAAQHRGELVWAALTLIQNWVAAGRPSGQRNLGSFEQWALVMGGILDAAGVTGFLGNLDVFYEVAASSTEALRGLVQAWWDQFGSGEVGVAQLFPVAESVESLDLEAASDKARSTKLGKLLGARRNQVVGGFRIEPGRKHQGAQLWRLVPVQPVNVVNISEHPGLGSRQSNAKERAENVHQPSPTFTTVERVA